LALDALAIFKLFSWAGPNHFTPQIRLGTAELKTEKFIVLLQLRIASTQSTQVSTGQSQSLWPDMMSVSDSANPWQQQRMAFGHPTSRVMVVPNFSGASATRRLCGFEPCL
jgi:hypothetical protein